MKIDKIKKLIPKIKSITVAPIVKICSISFVLLVVFSPLLSLLWLFVTTLYYLYTKNFKDIIKVWVFTIGVWYLIFSVSLSDMHILIGYEHTEILFRYLITHRVFFSRLCFDSVYLLHLLSAFLGFPIYIPSIVGLFDFRF